MENEITVRDNLLGSISVTLDKYERIMMILTKVPIHFLHQNFPIAKIKVNYDDFNKSVNSFPALVTLV